MAARRGKIARLPFALRERVCQMVADGLPAARICAEVNAAPGFLALGLAPVSPQNLSEWRAGGQRDWERDRAAAERLRILAESSERLANAAGGSPGSAAAKLLAGRFLDGFEAFEAEDAFKLARALAALQGAETAERRLELDRRRADLSEEALRLEREKFRWKAAEEALRLFQDGRAAAIADGPGTNEEKIRALLAYMDAQEAP